MAGQVQCPSPAKTCTGSEPSSFTHLRNTFCLIAPPTELIVSILNPQLHFLLCMTYLRLDETPNLGVHQTGRSSHRSAKAECERCREYNELEKPQNNLSPF